MKKVRVNIKNNNAWYDNGVNVMCQLPAKPIIGDVVHLPLELEKKLEDKVTEDLKDDYVNYIYKGQISFSDCVQVISVRMTANSEIIDIVLAPYGDGDC